MEKDSLQRDPSLARVMRANKNQGLDPEIYRVAGSAALVGSEKKTQREVIDLTEWQSNVETKEEFLERKRRIAIERARRKAAVEARKRKIKMRFLGMGLALGVGLSSVVGLVKAFTGGERRVDEGTDSSTQPSLAEEYQADLLPSEQQFDELVTNEAGQIENQIDGLPLELAETEDEVSLEEKREQNYMELRNLAVNEWTATESASPEAYVPTHNGAAGENDGITGPYGYMFAGRTEQMLRADGWSEERIQNLTKVRTLFGQEALDYLENNSLSFSEQEMEIMKEANIKSVVDENLEMYREKGVELLDFNPKIIAAIIQFKPLYGYGDFSQFEGARLEETGELNVYGRIAEIQKKVPQEDWVGIAKDYAEIVKLYARFPEKKFYVGWANRNKHYLELYIEGCKEQFPELSTQLDRVGDDLETALADQNNNNQL